MKKGITLKISLSLLITVFFINVMPFSISADNQPTYYNPVANSVFNLYTYKPRVDSNTYYTKKAIVNTDDVRVVLLGYISNNAYYTRTYWISLSTFKSGSSDSNPSTDLFPSTTTYDGVTYYYKTFNNTSGYDLTFYDVPFIDVGSSDNQTVTNAIRYTFGDLSVDPGDPITAGTLSFNYYTDFASTTQNNANAMKSNRDTITWDYDTTGSNIPGTDLKVDIRAVPSKYYAATEDALDSLSWGDLSIDSSYAADLGSYQINWNNRSVSYTWETVVDQFSYISNLPDWYDDMVNYWNLSKRQYSSYWYWTGWVYQIRLNTWSGDYTGEWQTIYQISSAPPEGSSQTINYYVNGTGLTEPIYQTIQNVNNQNNIINNTWYINGSPVDVNDSSGSSWWEQLLQFIRDLVGEILSFLGSIFDSLINAIFGLIEDLGIDFLGLFQTILNGIVDFFHNLDLTDINFQLPQSFNNFIQGFSGSVNGILGIWINNGLAVFIFVPLIIWLIGVIL